MHTTFMLLEPAKCCEQRKANNATVLLEAILCFWRNISLDIKFFIYIKIYIPCQTVL